MLPIVDSRATGHQCPYFKCGGDTGPPLEAHSLVAGSTAPLVGPFGTKARQRHRDGAALVAGFNPDGSKLEACLHTFLAQYLDDKVLKVAALKRAQEVVPLTSMDDQPAIPALISKVKTLQTSLKNKEKDQQYIEVARILMAKLPVPVRRQFCRHLAKESQKSDPSLSDKDSVLSKSTEARWKVPILAFLVSHLETERSAAGWW